MVNGSDTGGTKCWRIVTQILEHPTWHSIKGKILVYNDWKVSGNYLYKITILSPTTNWGWGWGWGCWHYMYPSVYLSSAVDTGRSMGFMNKLQGLQTAKLAENLLGDCMGPLSDTLICGLRMRGECQERFRGHRGLAISSCITAGARRTCHDACRNRYLGVSFEVIGGGIVPGILGPCATRNLKYLLRGSYHVTMKPAL